MTVFIDTNVFIASLTAEPGRGVVATELLNELEECAASVLTLMELRTVLAKKKQVEHTTVSGIIEDIANHVIIYTPDIYDFSAAMALQVETLLYPIDALLLAQAEQLDADLATFDNELLEHGGSTPESLL